MIKAHTLGPWAVTCDHIGVYAVNSDTEIMNPDHPCFADEDEAIANARLIAAAPELLEVLQDVMVGRKGARERARAIISKATGGDR